MKALLSTLNWQEPSPHSRKHQPILDGVRGLAILMVVLFHSNDVPQQSAIGHALTRVAAFGWTGVDLFFVLSGFLITGILLDVRGEWRTDARAFFGGFFGRRALRILPLYYAFLCLYFFVVVPLMRARGMHAGVPEGASQLYFWLHAANFWYLHRTEGLFLVGHFWSLSIEEHFYLFWPLVVWFAGRNTIFVAVLGIIAACSLRLAALDSGVEPTAVFALTPFRADALCVGAFAACAVRRFPAPKVTATSLGIWLFSIVVLVVLTFVMHHFNAYSSPRLMAGPGFVAIAFCFGSFIVLATRLRTGTLLQRALSAAPLRALGRWSYGIYVFHLAAIQVVHKLIYDPAKDGVLAGSPIASQVLVWGLVLAVCVSSAAISFHFFERRLLAFKEWFPMKTPLRKGALNGDLEPARPAVEARHQAQALDPASLG